MKKSLIIFLACFPGITFAYSWELEIKNLQFQVTQLDSFQNKYLNLVYFMIWTIFTLFWWIVVLNWFQNFKLWKQEIENFRKILTSEIQEYNKKNMDENLKKLQSQNLGSFVSLKWEFLRFKIEYYKNNETKNWVYWLSTIIEYLEFTSQKDKFWFDDALEKLEDYIDYHKTIWYGDDISRLDDIFIRIKEEKYIYRIEKLRKLIHK